MNRLATLFEIKKEDVLNVYCTAGFPELDDTLPVMIALQEHGADIIELGIPYSDPLADGPVIQKSSARALQNGMTVERLFEQLQGFREKVNIPVILMGYMNPVLQFGFDNFCKKASELGIDGLILPDLPAHEFENEYGPTIDKYGLAFIFLVTPETTDQRILLLDRLSSGFLYAVSSSSTTGHAKNNEELEGYLKRLQAMKLKNPVLVGFGIRDQKSLDAANRYSQGVIVGSAYINALEKNDNIAGATGKFLKETLGRKK
jgi:tryptophan synthase alpha chain